MVEVVPSPVAPTALIMAGLRAEARGDTTGALDHYQRALQEAEAVYGAEHPNTAFAHAALGIWHARFGRVEDALQHLRQSRCIEEAQGVVFVNIAETRLPADGSDPVARALIRLRLQRDLVLCAQDGGCSPSRVLALGRALGEVGP
jgi:Flp pilus assembly protein TadD